MPIRKPNVKIENGKVVFSDEILNYFESIRTNENSEWIDKYFEVLSNESNLTAEKYNGHHIIPCFAFKDKNHKTRKDTEPLANQIKNNVIKLSIYNHILAHYYLWKIFDNYDSKRAIQSTCDKNKRIEDLSENQIKEIAKIQEECAKKNRTEEEIKEKQKEYRMSEKGKESNRKRSAKYNNTHKELVSKRRKIYRKNHKEENSRKWNEYYKNNKDRIYEHKKEYRKNNKEKCQEYNHEYYQNNREKALDVNKKYLSQECYDPKEENICTLGALRGRKHRNMEKYKDINPINCVIKNQSLLPNISS